MTIKEVRNIILKKYLAEFNGQFPILVSGTRNNKPATPTEWVRISVIFNDGRQSTMGLTGNRKFLKMGFVVIQVFTPANKGTDLNDEMANNSLNLLDGITIERLWLSNGKINTVGDDGEYFQQNVSIELEFEDIR